MRGKVVYYDHGNKIGFHPGNYLIEIMEDRLFTLADASAYFKLPIKILDKLLNGTIAVTPEIAEKLAVTGISAKSWLNLQKSYDIACKKRAQERNIPNA